MLHHNDFGWHYSVSISDTHVFGFGGEGFAVFPTPKNAIPVNKMKLFERREVLDRCITAYNLFKNWHYGLLGWNCEHLARLVATGEAVSYQVKESPLAVFNHGGYHPDAQKMMENARAVFSAKANLSGGATTTITTKHNIQLKSNRADFTRLRDLLVEKNWKESDKETRSVMQHITGRNHKGYLKLESVQNLQSEDLHIIDQLWSYYSNDRFGFTAQSKVWRDVKGNYDEFSQCVGWNIGYNDLCFQKDAPSVAPAGHFPCYWRPLGHFGGTWWWINQKNIGTLLSRPEFR